METFITAIVYLTIISIVWHAVASWWSGRKEEDVEEDFKIGDTEQ